MNLLRAGRIFVFEPPPGVKANMLRTFSSIPVSRICKVSAEEPAVGLGCRATWMSGLQAEARACGWEEGSWQEFCITGLPWRPSGQESALLQGTWAQSLVRELKSHMPHNVALKKKFISILCFLSAILGHNPPFLPFLETCLLCTLLAV